MVAFVELLEEQVQQLASTMSHLPSVDVRVSTQDRDADQVAAEVLSTLKTLGVLA
jgi:hypothetical protein